MKCITINAQNAYMHMQYVHSMRIYYANVYTQCAQIINYALLNIRINFFFPAIDFGRYTRTKREKKRNLFEWREGKKWQMCILTL